MTTKFFDIIIIWRFGKRKVGKEEFYGARKTINIWDVDANKLIIYKLVEMRNNSKCLIGYLNDNVRSLLLILPKISGYV